MIYIWLGGAACALCAVYVVYGCVCGGAFGATALVRCGVTYRDAVANGWLRVSRDRADDEGRALDDPTIK